MPWTAKDAKKHCKSCDPSKWAKIANSVLKQCQADKGSDCEGRAVRIANSRAKMEEEVEALITLALEDLKKELEEEQDEDFEGKDDDDNNDDDDDDEGGDDDNEDDDDKDLGDKKGLRLIAFSDGPVTLEGTRQGKDGPISTVQMLRSGKFEHPWYGTLNFDETVFDNFIKNFEAGIPYGEFAIDFRHMSSGGAAGWIQKIFVERDKKKKGAKCNLFADVEWTPDGERAIRNKEYKFFSVEFTDQHKDSETGKLHGPTIYGGGLTNRPFIKKMRPLALSEDGKEMGVEFDEIVEKESEEVNEDMKTLEEIRKEIDDLNKKLSDVMVKLEEKPDDEEAKTEFTDTRKALDELRVEMDTALEAAEAAAKTKDDEIKGLQDTVGKLGESQKSLLEERAEERKVAREERIKGHVKEFRDMGISPAVCEITEKILLAEGASTISITLTDAEDKEEKLDLTQAFGKVFETLPDEAKVDTSERSKSEKAHSKFEERITVDDVHKHAKETGKSFEEALIELQLGGKSFEDD